MEITTPADLAACPAGTVVLDGYGIAWQSMPYMPHHWFATGSEVEKTPQQLMQSGPLRVIHAPEHSPARVLHDGGRMDHEALGRYLRQAIGYVLATAAGSSLPESWRTLSGQALTEALAVHLLAGMHPVLFEHSIALAAQVASAEEGWPSTAYDRYRPAVVVDSGNQRPALVCADCCNWEGWPGVRVWTAPEHAAVALADLIAAADEHERAEHPTGCRCDPYDCGHTKED